MQLGISLVDLPEGAELRGYARLTSRRNMGKICFCDARFQGDQIQIIFGNFLPNYQELIKIPLGSLLYIYGKKMVTKIGTPSLKIEQAEIRFAYEQLWPDKYHGLNSYLRYRKRVETLLVDEKYFAFVRNMSQALSIIRNILYEREFNEFVTGILHEKFEAGQARPFVTRCNANGKNLFLSLTSELKLKRLMISGFERVFEISQSFRNEGIDSVHSPEFTMLELYATDFDYQDMMKLLENLVQTVLKKLKINHDDVAFERISFRKAFEIYVGPWANCDLVKLVELYPDSFNLEMSQFTWLMKVIEKMIVPKIIKPTFLTELPARMSPLVKNDVEKNISERAFLIANGLFLADVYSDENNVNKLKQAFIDQAEETGIDVNDEYLKLVSIFGMPKTAGIGLGLNRLFMLLLGDLPNNIKETMLYPLL